MIFFVGLLCAVALAQPTTAPFTTLGATNAPSPVASAWQTTTTSTVRSRSPSTTAPFPSAPWPTESCSQPPSSIYSPCTSSDDRVRWASEATRTPLTQHTTSTSSLLLIGTVKSVVSAAGQSFQRVMFDDLWSVERGVVARETRPVFAYACSYYSYARNFNTSANIAAQFPVGRKLLLFAFSEFSFNGTANLIVSPCADETTGACLDATNPQCPSGLMRQLLLVAASANADLGRLLSIDSATMCSPTCKNGGQCKLGICACPLNFMGTTCEIARPPPPAVTVTTTRIVPGAGSNGSDIWISGTTRKIQIPILSADRTIPTGFARVMLLNLNPAAWCRMRLPNATLDGLPTWYFADSSEVDPTTSPRFLVTELLAVVDLSKLKWVAGTKAKSTIVVEHTLTLAESCKDAGSGYRVAVMLSANRNDDAALAGPYTGGQFTIGIGGCIGDGVAGMCMSNLGASTNFGVGANVCTLSSSPLKIAAKTVTAGQCTGADTVCCIPDRTNLVAAPISPYAFLAFDLPKSQATVQGPPISAYTWGETVKLTWTTNRLRPQPSPFSLFFPDGFCAIDEGLDTASASFELLLVAANNMMSPTGANTTIASLGKVKLSLGKFDAPLQQPQNFYTPYQVQFVAKFSETCKYTSLPFQVRESPCFSSATKTLIGTCRAVCNTWGDDTNAIGTCAGLTHASKCCGRIRNSNDGFRFADEGVEGEVPADETGATASSMSLAAVAVATTMMAQML
jgi:hypothetical protein